MILLQKVILFIHADGLTLYFFLAILCLLEDSVDSWVLLPFLITEVHFLGSIIISLVSLLILGTSSNELCIDSKGMVNAGFVAI